MPETLGERLRRLRKKSGLTQEDLADIVGVNPVTVSCWENNTYLPKTQSIKALAKALGVSEADLLNEPPPVHKPGEWVSKANFSAQERIIDRAVEAYYLVKNNDTNADKECQKVLALDLAFRKRTGYSALEAAGINIECDTSGKINHYWNLMTIDWVSHFTQ